MRRMFRKKNIFRKDGSKKRENYDIQYNEKRAKKKIFDADDGEYVDFEEIDQ